MKKRVTGTGRLAGNILWLCALLLSGLLLLPATTLADERPRAEGSAAAGIDEASPLFTPPAADDSSQQAPAPAESAAMTGGDQFSPILPFFKAVGVLLLIIGLMLLVAAIVRKLGMHQGPGGRGELLHIIETSPLGPRKYLAVVEAAGEYFLVGVSEQRIDPLGPLQNRELINQSLAAHGRHRPPGGAGFAGVFKNIRQQRAAAARQD
ncbi:MAG: flagellar biosynthetic protein FliO [Desulfurivibrio sp.]|nr:flagellar biosynthetic protein FliO [Desulfurivibrio sp.]